MLLRKDSRSAVAGGSRWRHNGFTVDALALKPFGRLNGLEATAIAFCRALAFQPAGAEAGPTLNR